jgi:DNA-binding NarL/FixJ family response regulator
LAIYRAHKGQVDLVVLDLGMPGMGGHRCLRELIKIDPGARVVIASGYSDGSHEEASLEAGAMGFIGKPYELKELAAQVRTYLDKKHNA